MTTLRQGPWSKVVQLLGVALIPVTIAVAAAIPELSLASTLLLLLFEVVLIALVAPLGVAVLCAVGAVLAANWYLTEPRHTFSVDDPSEVVALVVFVLTAVLAGVLVSRTLSAREAAARSRAETDIYRSLTATPADQSSPDPALRAILELLQLDELELRDRANRTVARVRRDGQAAGHELDGAWLEQDLVDGYLLLGSGPVVAGRDQPLIRSLGLAAVRLYQNQQLAVRTRR